MTRTNLLLFFVIARSFGAAICLIYVMCTIYLFIGVLRGDLYHTALAHAHV